MQFHQTSSFPQDLFGPLRQCEFSRLIVDRIPEYESPILPHKDIFYELLLTHFVAMQMTEDGAWIIVTKVWRKIIQKGTPSSFGRLLYGRIKQGYTFDHRFYEALQISLLSNKYGRPTIKHHYVSLHGSDREREKTGVRLRSRNGNPRSWSYFRIWGTGRGRRVPTSQARIRKNT